MDNQLIQELEQRLRNIAHTLDEVSNENKAWGELSPVIDEIDKLFLLKDRLETELKSTKEQIARLTYAEGLLNSRILGIRLILNSPGV